MTTRSTLRLANPTNLPGDARPDGGSTCRDAVPHPHDSQEGPHLGRVVHRLVTALRPHATYLELCGPIAPTRVHRIAQQPEALREPLVITTDGTILDGHVRWHVARDQGRLRLPCLEYDLTEEDALRSVIERHSTSNRLNAFCRIMLALRLEPYFRAWTQRQQRAERAHARTSNLTNPDRVDVRADIAKVAGVSTGNVTKVKQLLDTVIPATRDQLRQGAVSIHKAWQWRHLSATQQRDALWAHRHRGTIKKTIERLLRAHTEPCRPLHTVEQRNAVLRRLGTSDSADIVVAVVDVPGRAVVVTRACYDELLEKKPR